MADGNWADESSGERSMGQTDLGTGNQPDVKYRVESPIPNPAATARRSHVDFARQFDEEAFELETQLDAAVEKLGRK